MNSANIEVDEEVSVAEVSIGGMQLKMPDTSSKRSDAPVSKFFRARTDAIESIIR